jgi:hypothetical protein
VNDWTDEIEMKKQRKMERKKERDRNKYGKTTKRKE